MKGVPKPCTNMSVLGLFKQLYDNKTIKFDLPNDGNKFVCRNNKRSYNTKCIRFHSDMPIHQR